MKSPCLIDHFLGMKDVKKCLNLKGPAATFYINPHKKLYDFMRTLKNNNNYYY